ncbi:uncharacterized protein L3040_005202 [Drepanopeziza brunnea f. sp. 'multigermtubi']|uniref:uncharacterized protein n=1 Tax=Drepanopeziza brunnea f. sp. 'multigermtubi' TaxID=698441 RepID=UPI0023A0DDD8|nr:hypothetical protein L3040_005202 [Drepanopeziza brunnea f. sp. 'multigermtubi']
MIFPSHKAERRYLDRGRGDETEIFLYWGLRTWTWVCLLGIQVGLLRIRRMRKTVPQETIPQATEIWAAVGLFWVCQSMLNGIGLAVFEVVLEELSLPASLNIGLVVEDEVSLRSVVDRIFVSWLVHHTVVFFADVIIPFSKDRGRSWEEVVTTAFSRVALTHTFLHAVVLGSTTPKATPVLPVIPRSDPCPDSSNYVVRLQRTNHPNEGHRIVGWNLWIGQDAMDEMREILGPPGGFGELGFSMSADGVRFEAMGKGTSFVLDFEVDVTVEKRRAVRRRKTK